MERWGLCRVLLGVGLLRSPGSVKQPLLPHALGEALSGWRSGSRDSEFWEHASLSDPQRRMAGSNLTCGRAKAAHLERVPKHGVRWA